METLGFILAVVFSLLVGSYADKRGRSFGGWFFLSLLISPLFAFIICAVIKPKNKIK